MRTGYPQLEAQTGLYDMDFSKEVVIGKHLAMSPDDWIIPQVGRENTKAVSPRALFEPASLWKP